MYESRKSKAEIKRGRGRGRVKKKKRWIALEMSDRKIIWRTVFSRVPPG